MELADETVARLNRLAISGNGNLTLMVRDLLRSALVSAPSCIAVIIAVGDEEPFNAIDDRLHDGTAIVRASLRAQIIASGPGSRGQRVIFLAERAGEFQHFAEPTSAAAASAGHLQQIEIDDDLDAAATLTGAVPPEDDGVGGDDRDGAVDRAVGVLLDRGILPAEALRELQRRAQTSGLALLAQAELVLKTLN